MLPRTAAQVLMPPDGAFKTHTSLRETLNQADLDLPYFRTTEQNSPGLMQFANHKTAISPFAGELILQPWVVRKFLVFCVFIAIHI